MKSIKSALTLLLVVTVLCCKNEKENTAIIEKEGEVVTDESVKVIPITHGTLILETEHDVIYIDPTGGLKAFKNQKAPTLVLVTDIHGDHLSKNTLESLNLNTTTLIGPKAVTDKIPSTISKTIITLNNRDTYMHGDLKVEAIPMYNLREEALQYHTKGRGNGYVLDIKGERIYISGDTEDIPEMRNLKHIDKAFVCMNLPWTMTVESAANAVLEFKPKTVYPYHYRGSNGMSDVNKFKRIVVNGNDSINVKLLDWY